LSEVTVLKFTYYRPIKGLIYDTHNFKCAASTPCIFTWNILVGITRLFCPYKCKVNVKFILKQATKTQTGSSYSSTLSLTSALDGVGGKRHAPAALPPGKTAEKLFPTGIRSPELPVHSESLYRLSYPGPPFLSTTSR